MRLYVFDGFTFIDTIDIFKSCRWRRQYFGVGELELHIDDTAANIALCKIGRQICRPDRPETAEIEDVTLEDGNLIVKGRFLQKWLGEKIINEEHSANLSYQNAIRYWVQKYVMPNISELTLGTTVIGGNNIKFSTAYKNVLDNTELFLKAAELGHNVRKDTTSKKYYYDLFMGTDRTAAQSVNSKVIFSDYFENLIEPSYTCITSEQKNYAIVVGAGEGTMREKIIIDKRKNSMERRREIYVNCDNLSYEGLTVAQYRESLKEAGNLQLNETIESDNFTADIGSVPNFEYLKDWNLGDTVTVEHKRWGKSKDQRITEIEEIYEGAAVQIIPVLGNPIAEKINLEEIL